MIAVPVIRIDAEGMRHTLQISELARLRYAIQSAIRYLGPKAPECCGCEYEWTHALEELNAAVGADRALPRAAPMSDWELSAMFSQWSDETGATHAELIRRVERFHGIEFAAHLGDTT